VPAGTADSGDEIAQPGGVISRESGRGGKRGSRASYRSRD
jgi:hypothetical protein